MIEYLKIKKYKCFENFNINEFKQINLITGANDIGKTSLLEAVSFSIFNNPDSVIINLINLIKRRDPELVLRNKDIIKYIKENYGFFELKSNITKLSFKSPKTIEYLFKIDINDVSKIYNNLIENDLIFEENNNMVFIVDNGGSVIILKRWYELVQKQEDEDFINENIQKFDNNIEKFKIIGEEPSVKLRNKKNYIPVNELGEGLKRFIFMLIAFYKVGKNGYIFIDEMENGIWYKNYDLLWKNIFYLTKIFNTQLFITTHSKELISSFLKVSKEEKFENLSLIELLKKGNNVDYMMFDKNTLELELENDFEVRG